MMTQIEILKIKLAWATYPAFNHSLYTEFFWVQQDFVALIKFFLSVLFCIFLFWAASFVEHCSSGSLLQ